jgi:Tol biopolymer transport system component
MSIAKSRSRYLVVAIAGALLLVFAVARSATSSTTAAAHGARDGRIFFVDNDDQIASMNRHGGGIRHLTDFENEFASEPTVSPDGKTVAFVQRHNFRRGTLWTMRANGKHQQRITPRPGRVYSPTFAPDGDHIAFSTGTGIDLIRTKGGKAHNLHKGFDPEFSPNGKKLLYSDNLLNLHVLNLETGHEKRLPASLIEPQYSPDGHTLVGYSNVTVYRMRANGTHVHRLAHGLEPSWSPSGDQIIYTAIGPKVAVMSPNGGHQRTLGPGSEAAWSSR